MRFAPGTLVLFLAASSAVVQEPSAPAASSPTPDPAPAASPSPTPRYRLIPYGFARPQPPSPLPLLRFEDEAEVRSLEMNAAIARFFDERDERGNMLRGATPGGAPTLGEMAQYRPGVTPGVSLLGLALVVGKEVRKQIERRKGMPPTEASPSPSPSPAASPPGL